MTDITPPSLDINVPEGTRYIRIDSGCIKSTPPKFHISYHDVENNRIGVVSLTRDKVLVLAERYGVSSVTLAGLKNKLGLKAFCISVNTTLCC
jgi:hypothetical protein